MKKLIVLLAVLCSVFAVFAVTDQEAIKKYSYVAGANAYASYVSVYNLEAESFAQGVTDYASGKYSVSDTELQQIITDFSNYLMGKMQKENLAYAEEFLAQNKKEKGVVTTKSGLQYKINTRGTGARAKTGETVKVYYTLTLPDGTVVDQKNEETGSIDFKLDSSSLIEGFLEVCTAVPVGSKVTAWIHPDLGYGANGYYTIEPNQLLQFDVEILEIVK